MIDSQERKQNLKILRDEKDENNTEKKMRLEEESPATLKLTFRCHQPCDKELKKVVLEPAKPLELKEQVKEQLEAAKEKTVIHEVDLLNIVPQKPDADLKRDIPKNMEKLDRRTYKALADMMRERLQSKKMTVDEVAASLTLNPENS